MALENVENGKATGIKPIQRCDSKVAGMGADFETAVSETGFGLFNLILFLVTIPLVFSSQFEISSLSYVFPAAQCDLKLSLEDRGLINAGIYIGMIMSCFIWGSLVDIFGRRKILIITQFFDCIFILMAAFAQNLTLLMVSKFFGGFIINGSSMALTPYLSEFHNMQYRSRVPLTVGFLYSTGNIFLPLLAWAILPLNLSVHIYDGFELHTWNIFLFICILPAFSSAIFLTFLPESPKYLMSRGDNERALNIFQKIFNVNMKKEKELYPIKNLVDDKQINQKKYGVKEAWEQISPLFTLKYTNKLILVCSLQLFLMLCVNSLRLWLPQIFQLINDYELKNNKTTSFCTILNGIESAANTDETTCSMNVDNAPVYINSIIVGVTAVLGYLLAGVFVNKFGKKKILIFLGLASGISVASIYFAPDSITALILICIHLTCSCICIDVIITITVDLFPTYLRASALSLALMCGRIGSVLGNLLFPVLLQIGCAELLFTLGSIIIVCTIISIFLPNTDFKALE